MVFLAFLYFPDKNWFETTVDLNWLMSIATTTKRIEGNVTRDDWQRFLGVGTTLWLLEEMSKQYCNAVSGFFTLKCTLWIIPCNIAFTNLQPRFLGQQYWNNMLEQFETLLRGSVALKIVVVGMSRVTLPFKRYYNMSITWCGRYFPGWDLRLTLPHLSPTSTAASGVLSTYTSMDWTCGPAVYTRILILPFSTLCLDCRFARDWVFW